MTGNTGELLHYRGRENMDERKNEVLWNKATEEHTVSQPHLTSDPAGILLVTNHDRSLCDIHP